LIVRKTKQVTLNVKANCSSSPESPELGPEFEKHKQDLLKKQKEGKGHWKPELASNSEESVAADRHEHNDHSEEGIKELQKKSIKYVEEKDK
jgi:hypothetical protein